MYQVNSAEMTGENLTNPTLCKGNLHSSPQQLFKLQHNRINYKLKYTKVNKNVALYKTHQTHLISTFTHSYYPVLREACWEQEIKKKFILMPAKKLYKY